MKKTKLFVLDTNTLVSAFIVGSDTCAKAFDKAFDTGRILASSETYRELLDVFSRPRFDKYAKFENRMAFVAYFERQALFWPGSITPIQVCRDPKDNKFLSLALAANAACLISGDRFVRDLHPFQGIPILNPADFLKAYS